MAFEGNGFDARPQLSDKVKRIMMEALVRNQEAFEAVADQLIPEHFTEYDGPWRIVWATVLDYYDQHGKLPKRNTLWAEIQSRLDEDPGALAEAQVLSLKKFLVRAFRKKPSEFDPDWATAKAAELMADHVANRVRQTLSDPSTPSDMPALMQGFADDVTKIESLKGGQIQPLFPEGYKPERIVKVSTGIEFINVFLGGGHAAREVYGLLGGYGSCKTTLALQICIEGSKWEYAQWRKANRQGPLGVWVMLSYETPIEEIRLRAMVYAAQIDRTRMEDLPESDTDDPLANFSTSKTLEAYEQHLFRDQLAAGFKVKGEKGRYREWTKRLNRNFCVQDMTGNDPLNPRRGFGWLPEIVQVVRQVEQNYRRMLGHEVRIAGVMVDYAGACAKRALHRAGTDRKDLRHYLGEMPLHAVDDLAIPFQCPVWLLHQTSTAANAKSPGAILNTTDVSEAGNFAENCAFSIMIGTPTKDNHAVAHLAKQRRTRPQHSQIIEINGALGKVEGVSGRFVLDEASRKIIKATDAAKVNNEDVPRKKKRKRRDPGEDDDLAGAVFMDE
jgi:hypothetical protein